MESLEDRRKNAILKFAQKAQKNPVYSHWFEENQNPRRLTQRKSKKYVEKLAKTNRLYKSPVYTMRRLLNDDYEENLPETPTAFEIPLNDPYGENI